MRKEHAGNKNSSRKSEDFRLRRMVKRTEKFSLAVRAVSSRSGKLPHLLLRIGLVFAI